MRFWLVFCALLCAPFLKAQSLTANPGGFLDLPAGFEDLGGWSLQSDDARFGGLSALLIGPDGHLRVLSDHGHLFTLRFAVPFEDVFIAGDGLAAPQGFQAVDLTLLSAHQPPSHRRDAESLAWLDRGGAPRLYISFERDHRIQRHFGDGRADRRLSQPIALQNTFGNTGIEALSSLPQTCLFAVTEGVRRQGGLRAFKYCGGQAWMTRVYMPSGPGFAPTAADLAPDGQHVYLIERKFSGLLGGFQARLVRIPVADIQRDIPLTPRVVLDLSSHMLPTWNIEGLALKDDGQGALIALMVTDDNYQGFLPTMLLGLRLLRH